MRRAMALAAVLAAGTSIAASTLVPFSTLEPGALAGAWRSTRIGNIRPNDDLLVRDEGATVLQVRSSGSAGAVAATLDADARATPMLAWRWKVDRVVAGADLTRKAGDDYAARVYVFFDLPVEALSFAQRARIFLARAIYGQEVPTAALCYVWDNRQPVGTMMPNAYTERVRMVVLESGAAKAGTWARERRDVEADYRRAFGLASDAAVPRLAGIAAGADTDQTGETVRAWFGDFVLEPRP